MPPRKPLPRLYFGEALTVRALRLAVRIALKTRCMSRLDWLMQIAVLQELDTLGASQRVRAALVCKSESTLEKWRAQAAGGAVSQRKLSFLPNMLKALAEGPRTEAEMKAFTPGGKAPLKTLDLLHLLIELGLARRLPLEAGETVHRYALAAQLTAESGARAFEAAQRDHLLKMDALLLLGEPATAEGMTARALAHRLDATPGERPALTALLSDLLADGVLETVGDPVEPVYRLRAGRHDLRPEDKVQRFRLGHLAQLSHLRAYFDVVLAQDEAPYLVQSNIEAGITEGDLRAFGRALASLKREVLIPALDRAEAEAPDAHAILTWAMVACPRSR